MKKAIVITIILTLVAGVGGGVWLKTRLDAQTATTVAQEQKQEQPKSKYDIGPADAQEMLELVNEERQRVGVAPLVMDERLNASAQEKADDMVKRNYRDHVSPEGIHGYELVFKNTDGECRHAGENHYTGAYHPKSDVFVPTSRRAFNGWMSSKPHREAIQNPKYTKTGFGVSTNNTSLIAVQHFCQP